MLPKEPKSKSKPSDADQEKSRTEYLLSCLQDRDYEIIWAIRPKTAGNNKWNNYCVPAKPDSSIDLKNV